MGRYGRRVPHDGSELYGIRHVGFLTDLGEMIHLRREARLMVFMETLDSDFQF